VDWDGVSWTARGKGPEAAKLGELESSRVRDVGNLRQTELESPLIERRNVLALFAQDVPPLAQPTWRSGCQQRWMWM
jgi:hypothetical protein